MDVQIKRFGEFELDVDRFELRRRGCRVTLARQPMELLILLVGKSGRLAPREEIVSALWGANPTADIDAGINNAIRRIRVALGDDSDHPRFLETVPGKGYRFVSAVLGAPGAESVSVVLNSETPAGTNSQANNAQAPQPQKGAVTPGAATTVVHADDEVRVGELRQAYWWRHEALKRNLLFQFVTVVGVGLVIWQGKNDVALPPVGITFSTTWLCFLSPVVLFYLWADFGFVLDDLIKSRSEAWKLLSRMGVPERATVFNDGGYMDGWFMCFRPTEHAINTQFLLGSAFIFNLMYVPLFAAHHAFAIRSLALGTERAMSLADGRPLFQILLLSLPWFAAATYVFGHLQFRIGGRNPNWLQPVVVGLSVIVLYFLSASG